jgi:tetratricopeptide (TPR) repeat protein
MVMINKRKASRLNKIVSGVLALSFALGMTLFAVLPAFNSSGSNTSAGSSTAANNTTSNRPLVQVKSTKETQFKSLVGQAELAAQAKNWKEAVSFLEQAIKLKKDKKTAAKLANAYLNLAKEEAKTNQQNAKTLLNKAIEQAPNSPAALEAKQLLSQ